MQIDCRKETAYTINQDQWGYNTLAHPKNEMEDCSNYATLSHCWGTLVVFGQGLEKLEKMSEKWCVKGIVAQ